MGDFFKWVFGGLGVLAFITILGFFLQYVGLFETGFFSPRYEGVRRDTMIQSRQYSEGMYRELARLHIQYLQTTDLEQKIAIRAMIVHEVQAVDTSRLPPELRVFLQQIGAL